MTRDDAIHIVDVAFDIPLAVRRAGEDRTYQADEIRKAKDMAIKALSQEQQSEWERDHEVLKAYADGQESMKPCKDAISRQAAIDAIWDGVNMDIYTREVKECLEKLPSVSTEKTGRWKWVQYDFDPRIGNWHCSECKNIIYCGVEKKGLHETVIYKYCPWCGAKMEVEE